MEAGMLKGYLWQWAGTLLFRRGMVLGGPRRPYRDIARVRLAGCLKGCMRCDIAKPVDRSELDGKPRRADGLSNSQASPPGLFHTWTKGPTDVHW
jgi:hypothetical protein